LATIALAIRISSLEFIVASSGIDGVRLTSAQSAQQPFSIIDPENRGAKDSKSARRPAALPPRRGHVAAPLGSTAN
jgi:hypothetical protein